MKINDFYKEQKIKILAVGLVILGICIYKQIDTRDITKNTTVGRGDIIETVKVSGVVKSAADASLSFEKGGVIQKITVKEGDTVRAGDILASLSAGDVYGQVLEAEANVQALEKGARPEEIAVKQSSVDSAKTDVSNAYRSALESMRSSYTNVTEAIRTQTKSYWQNGTESGYQLAFSSCDSLAESPLGTKRAQVEQTLNTWRRTINTISESSTNEELASVLKDSYANTVLARDLLQEMSGLITTPCALGNSSLDTIRANTSLAKSSVQLSLADLSLRKNTISSLLLAESRAEKDLALLLAGNDENKIKAGRARLVQARGLYNKTVIISPINGTVAKINYKVGESANTNTPLLRITGNSGFQIEGKVTEADVVKLVPRAKANITIDALSGEVITGTLSVIDQAEESSTGSPLYRVVVTIDGSPSTIKSGMSADVSLITSETKNVLRVPTSFIKKGGDKTLVQKVITEGKKKTFIETAVTTGKKSTDGYSEILQGLQEGDVLNTWATTTAK